MASQFSVSILDQCQAAIICLGAEGEVVYANPMADLLLGASSKPLLGLPFLHTFFPDTKNFDFNKPFRSNIQLRRGGITHHIRCEIVPTSEENHPGFQHMVTLSDQTAFEKIKEERDRLIELAAICELMPTLLHEFKNPLACIQALAELMQEETMDEDLLEHVNSILDQVRRMELGFDGLGTTTDRLLSKRLQCIGQPIRDACQVFERQFRSRNLVLETHIEDMEALPLEGGGIRGLLFNLLNNAKQACSPGDRVTVHAGLSPQGDAFQCAVRDTGPGMTPEVLAHCTQLFFTTKPLGSGVGLALCRTAVEKTGGTFEVKSEVGQGTEITFTLPIQS